MPPRLPGLPLHANCRVYRRGFSRTAAHSQVQTDLPTNQAESGHVRLTNRALISLTGPDSTAFLQGLITQNVVAPKKRASITTPFYAGFLNAQGRVLHDTFIYPIPPNANAERDNPELGYLIEVDKDQISTLLKHFKKHKLRSKLKLRALDKGEADVWAVWDNTGMWGVQSENEIKGSITCVDNRAPGFGYRVLVSGGSIEGFPGKAESLSQYSLRRYLHGIAEGQVELTRESALPLDSDMDIMGGIDFHKGCYLGQELTIRTHHRGVVRKRILPVQLYHSGESRPVPSDAGLPVYSAETPLSLPPTGSNITKASASGKGRSAGKFIAGIGNIGLALCRLETMTDLSLTGESSHFNPDDEFKISWDADPETGIMESGEVKVQAFIPPWVKDYIHTGGVRQRTTKEDVQRARDKVEQMEEESRR